MNLPAPLPVPDPVSPRTIVTQPVTVRPVAGVRVSDADREKVATRLREAATEGYLTMPEADDRLAAAYAAVTRAELATLTTDLPAPVAESAPVTLDRAGLTPRARRRLTIHAAIIAVLAVNLVVRAVITGMPFFFPIIPLVLTLLLHYALARRPTWSEVQAFSRGTSAA